MKNMLKGFQEFIMRGNVVDLAVAVVIGTAFTSVVNAIVSGIITPIIGAIGGNPDFSNLAYSVNGSEIKFGEVLNALLSFLIVAAVIYFLIVMPMNQVMARMKKGEKVDPTTKACPECLSAVPLEAKRCMYCTSVLATKNGK
jgi:large conductance mechanosensitive channel